MLRIPIVIVLTMIFLLQGYTLIVEKEGDSPLPPRFGNFAANRATLETRPEKEEFTFAVMGDTKSLGTFERLAEELRKLPLDFAVLLGDVAYDGTEEAHRYLRAELHEYAQPFPVFYVAGNHDVSLEHFTVNRFEESYGPSIFSFHYQGSLFVVLRILNEPFSNEESIAFLQRLKAEQPAKYRRIFVFMHIPPPISADVMARPIQGHERLVALFDELGVDYVFAGDYHGYAQIKRRNTTYIVSGGGGARLNDKIGKQFHHALLMRVSRDSVSERFVHVNRDHDVEDFFERAAIMYISPWMARNVVIVYGSNAVLFLLWLVALNSLGAGRTMTKSAAKQS